MTGLQHVDADRLREWLPEVRNARTTAALMLAIAYDRGIGTDELAAWYDRPAADIEAAIDAVDAPTVTVEIARRERVDVAAVAAESNLAVGSVERWFAALGD